MDSGGSVSGEREKVEENARSRNVDRKQQEEKEQLMEVLHELRLAAIRGNEEAVKNCLNKGISVNQPLRGGWTALMFACSMAHPALVEFLLQQGANPNFHKELFTPLMAVCASSQRDQERLTRCVDLLLRYKAEPNIAERHHTTALMFAAKQGHTKVVGKLLADPRCNLDTQDSQGWTALMWAVNKGEVEEVQLLVNKNASVTVKDRRGQTAVDIARSKHHDNLNNIIMKILTRKHNPPDEVDPDIGLWYSNDKFDKSKQTSDYSSDESNSLVQSLLYELAASIINNNDSCENKITSVLKKLELEGDLDRKQLVSQISSLISGSSPNTSVLKQALVPAKKKPNSAVEKSLKNFPYSAVEAREIMREMVRHLEGLYTGISYLRLHMQGSCVLEDKCATITEITALSERALFSSRQLFDEIRFFNQYARQLEESERLVPSDYELERRSGVDTHRSHVISGYVLATAALVLLYNTKHLLTSLFTRP